MSRLHLLICLLFSMPMVLWCQNDDCLNIAFSVDTEASFGNCDSIRGVDLCMEQNLLNALSGKSFGGYALGSTADYAKRISLQIVISETGKAKVVSAEDEGFGEELLEKLASDLEQLDTWKPATKDQETVCSLVKCEFTFKSKTEIASGYVGEVYKIVDRMPIFDGPKCSEIEKNSEREQCSKGSLFEFVYGSLEYPKKSREQKVQGMVVVQFVIEKDGIVNESEIIRSLTPETDQAVLDVVNKMPAWIPGSQEGDPVRVLYTLPIRFAMQN